MSPTSPAADPAADRHPVITEEDLAALDTSEGHAEDTRPEEPVNAVLGRLGGALAIVTTALIVVLVTLAVVMRYVLNSSLPIAAEGPTYLFPWLIAGGAIVAQSHRGHIAVDLLVSRLTGRAHQRAQTAIWAFSTVLLGYLTYLAVYLIPPMAAQSTPIMGWPQLGSFGAFLVMVAVMTVQAGVRTLHYARHGAPTPADAAVAPGTAPSHRATDDAPSAQDSPKENPDA
ncbi:TRAP transporter small permease [Brachybacterium saurashtrense]|uniref:TRAP transporter small permease n=1 Tax=Brachybacterium saurashtrense TaxID=556288 RepID=A0A345YRV9_9MICO|nr:TRAP transporter small permease [Brachybacterium saurashtrense]AXK46661.1 TRAP transporter small permease [Brachybacterium saurashtrense]RRR22375.1 TRAP transporter small permease [Brachybacterium saurashtrense]